MCRQETEETGLEIPGLVGHDTVHLDSVAHQADALFVEYFHPAAPHLGEAGHQDQSDQVSSIRTHVHRLHDKPILALDANNDLELSAASFNKTYLPGTQRSSTMRSHDPTGNLLPNRCCRLRSW